MKKGAGRVVPTPCPQNQLHVWHTEAEKGIKMKGYQIQSNSTIVIPEELTFQKAPAAMSGSAWVVALLENAWTEFTLARLYCIIGTFGRAGPRSVLHMQEALSRADQDRLVDYATLVILLSKIGVGCHGVSSHLTELLDLVDRQVRRFASDRRSEIADRVRSVQEMLGSS